ncbi:alpha/beta fold hydrolase BchO [Roseisalinus antarcticus]|uniref:Sigma factor SigB regulation protein RsbQ n=1 Tax=Roseisalinus antarcticus TaxID=254357 RepID=A0A1Y5S2U2_9RHOB|nr:alpha/beta fold hydrolase BchO [Roseisalinus antarcticus]SLN31047.1 Sigma factor SigB regulation protein RsbQ [Roseisalinus antarcticus]
MRWPQDAETWPLTRYSRQVLCRPHRWHVQEAGSGGTILLVHGAGGATQSWRGVFPLLMQTHRVVAIDLPGQGLSALGARQRCGLDAMAEDLSALLVAEDLRPDVIVGHSAGAAIALRMALSTPVPVIGINPALMNFDGVAGWLFPIMAKVLALNPLSASIFTATSSRRTVKRLLAGTGSILDPEGEALYHRLTTDRAHVDATLTMMSQWSLDGLLARLGRITSPVRFLVGQNDRAVLPASVRKAASRLPDCEITEWEGLGHLMHEEAPERVADWIRAQV